MKILSKMINKPVEADLEIRYKSLRDREQSGLLDAAGRAELTQIKAQLQTEN